MFFIRLEIWGYLCSSTFSAPFLGGGWDSHYAYVCMLDVVSQVYETLFIFNLFSSVLQLE